MFDLLSLLEHTCSECNGKGFLGQHGPKYHPDSFCKNCCGSGFVPTDVGRQLKVFFVHQFQLSQGRCKHCNGSETCYRCESTGYEINELGQKVFDFLENKLNNMDQDRRDMRQKIMVELHGPDYGRDFDRY